MYTFLRMCQSLCVDQKSQEEESRGEKKVAPRLRLAGEEESRGDKKVAGDKKVEGPVKSGQERSFGAT